MKFKIELVRHRSESKFFEVEATDDKEAKHKAYEMAREDMEDENWVNFSDETEVNNIEEIKD